MARPEALQLLGDAANPDGAFLVRKSKGKHILSIKYFNTSPSAPQRYEYANYPVNVGTSGEVWFVLRNKFSNLIELINYCVTNKEDNVATKLTNICLIPNPHSDQGFEWTNEHHDSLRVPISELSPRPWSLLGKGAFGEVYKARFRGNLDVAVKQLHVHNEKDGKANAEKAIEEFFTEIATMRGLNHPNLVQLFAYVGNALEGNLMIQEFMAQGDLKNYLKNLKKDPDQMRQDTRLWSRLLSWCIEVARGMERLESLKVVHRDLAARSPSPFISYSTMFSGTFCWTSSTVPRLQTSVCLCKREKKSLLTHFPSNGRPLRHLSIASFQACE